MAEENRNAIGLLAFLMNEMNTEGVLVAIDRNGSGEMRELIQFGFGLPPVVLLLPILYEPSEIIYLRAISAVVREGRLARESRQFELLLKLLEGCLWHGNLVRLDGRTHEGLRKAR